MTAIDNLHHAVSLTTKPEISAKLKQKAIDYAKYIDNSKSSEWLLEAEARSMAEQLVKDYTLEMRILTHG